MSKAIAVILSCFACATWVAPVHGDTIRVAGMGGALEAMRLVGEAFQKTHPQTEVTIMRGLGSRGGLRAVQAGAADIAVSGPPAPAEPGLRSAELGRTPIIFTDAAHRSEASVTMADLVEIYSGRRMVRSDGSRVRVILRPNGDPDTALLRALSPAMSRAIDDGFKVPGVKIAATDRDAADAIESIPGAFGMSTLLHVRAEARPLAPVLVNGVAPGLTALANGSYPYAKTLYLVTRSQWTVAVQQYLSFLASPAGHELLTGLGLHVAPGLMAALRGAR